MNVHGLRFVSLQSVDRQLIVWGDRRLSWVGTFVRGLRQDVNDRPRRGLSICRHFRTPDGAPVRCCLSNAVARIAQQPLAT